MDLPGLGEASFCVTIPELVQVLAMIIEHTVEEALVQAFRGGQGGGFMSGHTGWSQQTSGDLGAMQSLGEWGRQISTQAIKVSGD